MTKTTVAALPRVFKIGAIRLDDPDSSLPPDEAVKLYQRAYPYISHCTLSEPTLQNGVLEYAVTKPPVQVKG